MGILLQATIISLLRVSDLHLHVHVHTFAHIPTPHMQQH